MGLGPRRCGPDRLGDGEDKTDVDFGYNGTGSLGDLVWFDTNGDGLLTTGEPGLEAVEVIVTWFGIDGAAGGGDDAVFVTTTDGAGAWSVDGLPPGGYDVTVNPTSLPAGMAPTYDLDGTTISPDGNWTGSLGDGEDKTDVDFGYNGSGQIGDFVWTDTNADGLLIRR